MHAEVGLTPRTYARIARLHRALHRLRASPTEPRWASLAAQTGYADQPHLIREFRALLGETPVAWSRRAAGGF